MLLIDGSRFTCQSASVADWDDRKIPVVHVVDPAAAWAKTPRDLRMTRRNRGAMSQSDPSQVLRPGAAGEGDAGWRRALGELALACSGSFPGEEAQRLRELRRLLAGAPARAFGHGLLAPPAERLDELIAAGAGASAVLAFVGPDCGYLISRGAAGQHLASLILPGATEETSASGDTLALALIGAIALALAGADGGCTDLRPPDRAARLN